MSGLANPIFIELVRVCGACSKHEKKEDECVFHKLSEVIAILNIFSIKSWTNRKV